MTDCNIVAEIAQNEINANIVTNQINVTIKGSWSASNTPFSAWFMEYIEPTNNWDWTITIPATTCRLYKNTTFDYTLGLFDLDWQTFSSIPDNAVSYIVWNYNSWNPELQNITDVELITESDVVPYVTIFRQWNSVLFLSWDEMAKWLPNKIHQRLVKTQRFARQSWLTLSEHTERYVDISAGKTYNWVTRINNEVFNSETATFKEFKHVAWSWAETLLSQYDNEHYDDWTDLVEMLPNKYSVRRIYRWQQESAFGCYIFWSDQYTSISLANAELAPSDLPASIANFWILVWKIIIKKWDTSWIVLNRDWNWWFQTVWEKTIDISALELEAPRNIDYESLYMEYTETSWRITQIDYWLTSAKTTKLFTKVLTYTGDDPTSIVMTNDVTGKKMTTTLVWTAGVLTSTTKVLS